MAEHLDITAPQCCKRVMQRHTENEVNSDVLSTIINPIWG